MKVLIKSFVIASTLMLQTTYALTPAARSLINFETKSNAVATRSNDLISIPHFEIPLNMLEVDFADRFSEQIREHLIFEKDGQKFVRWILNPEDSKWHLQVAEHFKSKGLNLEMKYYFSGYQTASRSYIVEDPSKQIQFSVKSSTDKTGGYWADKKQPVGEAIDSRLNADLLNEIQKNLNFQHAVIMDEPAIMKIPPIDQAVVIRDLAEINDARSGKIYVPGFSVLHEKTGADIALKNGSNNPYEFWTEHYVKATARALGEFAARTGMQFDSPHSQNFLVELDSNYKPTGRIVLRDLADLYIYKNFTRVIHSEANVYLEKFTQKGNILDHIAAGFGPLHGNQAPSWISPENYSRWKDVFFAEFEQSFSKTSGLPLSAFKKTSGHINGKYFSNSYRIEKGQPGVAQFWQNIFRYKSPTGQLNCSQIMFLK